MVALYTLQFDGACGPKNPGGTASYGFTLHYGGEEIDRGSGVIGSGPAMSNNVAEYVGLIRGFEAFLRTNGRATTHLTVRGDSQLVINQMSRRWKAKAGLYLPYYEEALLAAGRVRGLGVKISFEWVPREQNEVCDALSKNCAV